MRVLDKLTKVPGSIELLTEYRSIPWSINKHRKYGHHMVYQNNNTSIDIYDMDVLITQEFKLMFSKYASRADRHDFGFKLSDSALYDLWISQQGRCAKTNMIMEFTPGSVYVKNPLKISLDRIVNSRGYYKDNIQFVTHFYNNAKSTWGEADVDSYFEKVYETKQRLRFSEIMKVPV